jgi:hypothetical protein
MLDGVGEYLFKAGHIVTAGTNDESVPNNSESDKQGAYL